MRRLIAVAVLLFSLTGSTSSDPNVIYCLKNQSPISDLERIAILRDEIATQKLIDEKYPKLYRNVTKVGERLFCGLSRVETDAIMAYTADFYALANKALRERENLEVYFPFIRTLVRGLKKIAPYRGTILRGSNLGEWQQLFMAAGIKRTFKDRGFLSASLLSPFGRDYLITIKSKSCRYIAPFSFHFYESEVLCLPFTKFKVESIVMKSKDGGGTLNLTE